MEAGRLLESEMPMWGSSLAEEFGLGYSFQLPG